MNCPRCGVEVLIAKYKQVDCKCGAKLLLIKINGKQEIHDLTPEEETN